MTRLLGIDLGTSSVKAVVINERGAVLGVGTQEYAISTPQPGYAEQNPRDWWRAAALAVYEAVSKAGGGAVDGIGLSGQMHGLVLLDDDNRPHGPAIIWPDQRSVEEVHEIATLRLGAQLGTAPATGFFGPSLRWLRRHDPARLDAAQAAILPKDYLRLCLTGTVGTEPTDASATALFDVTQRTWLIEALNALELPTRLLPRVEPSEAVVGTLTPAAAEALNIRSRIPVVAGCADQVAQAIGNGLLHPGGGSVTVGTGGQLFLPLDTPQTDSALRLHTFCHAPPDRWYVLGAMLSAGLSLRWLRDTLGLTGDPHAYERLDMLAAAVEPGADGLIFLPYLVGERAPLMDPLARGGFIGLTLRHGPGHMARAIMEGVAYALRQILDVMEHLPGAPLGDSSQWLLASGGGLHSPLWRQIVADVLGRPLRLATQGARAGVGAALLAGLGIGTYGSYDDLREVVGVPDSVTEPFSPHAVQYEGYYRRFVSLYPLLRSTMHAMAE